MLGVRRGNRQGQTRLPWIVLLGALLLCLCGLAVALRPVDPLVRVIPVGPSPDALTVDVRAGRVLVLDGIGGHLSLLDADTGQVAGTATLGMTPLNVFPLAMALDAPRGHAFIYTQDGTLYTVDVRTGITLRSTPVASTPTGPNLASVAVDTRAQRIFVVNAAARVVTMLDATSGAVMRIVVTNDTPAVLLDVPAARAAISTHPAAVPARVLDLHTGHDARPSASRCFGKGALVVPHPAYTIDPAAGVWNLLTGPGGSTLCTVMYGRTAGGFSVDAQTGHLFVLDAAHGTVQMVDESRGVTVRSVRVAANPVALAVDTRRHHLLVVSTGRTDVGGHVQDDGALSVLDTWTGRIVGTVRAGVAPLDVAVDERTGLAFVLDANINRVCFI